MRSFGGKTLRAFFAFVSAGSTALYIATAIAGCEKENTEATTSPEGGGLNIDATTTPPTPSSDGAITDAGGGPDPLADAAPSLDAGLACAIDQDCNGGKCFSGVCICDLFLRVQPDGKCGQTPEPTCLDQVDAGSRCNSPQPVCKELDAGEIMGSPEANRSCGDFAPAVCCFAGCRGPSFYCCGVNGPAPQICIQGWRTCKANERATFDASTCN